MDTTVMFPDIRRNNLYALVFGNAVLGLTYKINNFIFDFNTAFQPGTSLTSGTEELITMPSVRIAWKFRKNVAPLCLVYSKGVDVFNPTRRENQYKFTRINKDSMIIERDFYPHGFSSKSQITLGTARNYLFYSKTTGIPLIGFYDKNYNYSRVATKNTEYYGNYISPNSVLEHYGITVVSPDISTNSISNRVSLDNDTSGKVGWSVSLKTMALFSVQKYQLPNADGVQKLNYFTPSNKVRFNFYISNGRKWMFTFLYNIQNKMRPSFYYDAIIPKQQTIDLLFNYNFTRQFSANIKLFNITGTNLYGPQATGSVDDLYLQPQRFMRMLVTMNYALE